MVTIPRTFIWLIQAVLMPFRVLDAVVEGIEFLFS